MIAARWKSEWTRLVWMRFGEQGVVCRGGCLGGGLESTKTNPLLQSLQ